MFLARSKTDRLCCLTCIDRCSLVHLVIWRHGTSQFDYSKACERWLLSRREGVNPFHRVLSNQFGLPPNEYVDFTNPVNNEPGVASSDRGTARELLRRKWGNLRGSNRSDDPQPSAPETHRINSDNSGPEAHLDTDSDCLAPKDPWKHEGHYVQTIKCRAIHVLLFRSLS